MAGFFFGVTIVGLLIPYRSQSNSSGNYMEMRLHSKKRKPALWTVMAMMIAQLIFHPRMCTGGALRPGYYAQTCPNAENIIRAAMEWGMQQDSGTAPGVLRLHFHDCFVDVSSEHLQANASFQ